MAVWLRGFRLWIGMKRIDVPLVRKGFIIHDISWLWHITYHDDILNTYYDFEKELLQKKNVGLRGCLLAHRHIHTQTHLAVYYLIPQICWAHLVDLQNIQYHSISFNIIQSCWNVIQYLYNIYTSFPYFFLFKRNLFRRNCAHHALRPWPSVQRQPMASRTIQGHREEQF